MPLTMAPLNAPLKIVRITAGEGVKRHLAGLGISEGAKIELVSSTARGMIVAVMQGRLCIDGELAKSIFIA